MTRYRFIDQHKGQFGARRCCRVLGISASSYYHWRRRALDPSARRRADQRLLAQICRIHRDSGGAYGAPRIHAELQIACGVKVGRKRVARLMRTAGLVGCHRRRRWRPGLTRRDPRAAPAPDLCQRKFSPPWPAVAPVAGIDNFRVANQRVWRGANPRAAGWRALAAHGVRIVVDLRAEAEQAERALPARLGMTVVAVPVGDGQGPSSAAVARALAAIDAAPGRVFVHLFAGVGRNGSIVAAYLVRSGQATAGEALLGSLAVSPPSLEQLAFMAGLNRERVVGRPAWPLVAVSRLLDGPRVLWGHLA